MGVGFLPSDLHFVMFGVTTRAAGVRRRRTRASVGSPTAPGSGVTRHGGSTRIVPLGTQTRAPLPIRESGGARHALEVGLDDLAFLVSTMKVPRGRRQEAGR